MDEVRVFWYVNPNYRGSQLVLIGGACETSAGQEVVKTKF